MQENLLIRKVKNSNSQCFTVLVNEMCCICGSQGVYHMMMIIKMFKKMYFYRMDFQFPSLLSNNLVVFESTLLPCMVWLLII